MSDGAPHDQVDADADAVISVDGLVKRYGDVVALGPIDLVVRPGERLLLVGHNGSGKTTLIRTLAGLLEPSDGSVEIVGHPAGSRHARKALAYLADAPVFYDDLSVREHLEYVARLHGAEDWEARADELVHRTGLDDRVDDLPSTFSRGLRQKAAICLAFVRPAEVLVVDEPFVGLDRAGRDTLVELLGEVAEHGTATLVATHEPDALPSVDRVVELADGTVLDPD